MYQSNRSNRSGKTYIGSAEKLRMLLPGSCGSFVPEIILFSIFSECRDIQIEVISCSSLIYIVN